ncbi:MAG: ATP-dependent dethiobiotin synthetase BioD, partial [Gemmataceae bacterium]
GLLCPLTDTGTIADLVGVLAVPLIVVARRSLGTHNHTLLTLEVARGRGLKVAGLVVTETQPGQPGAAEETVVAELRRRIDVPLLAVLPHRGPGEETPAELAAVPWAELAGNLAYSD